MEQLTRDEQIKALRDEFRWCFNCKNHPILIDSEDWAGTDSLPPGIRLAVNDVVWALEHRVGKIKYVDIGVAYVLAMSDLGKLEANGKGYWRFSPLRPGKPRDD